MKKFVFLIALILGTHILSSTESHAQWEPDVRLTNDTDVSWTSLNNARCIAASGNVVHAVWYDTRDGNREIYYKRSVDGGVNWETDTRMTNASGDSWYPSISLSGLFVHVVWMDTRDGNTEVYYKRSTDEGVSWEADVRLTNNTSPSVHPSISVSGLEVHLVWRDYPGNYEIYYKRSIDGGANWGSDIRLTNNSATSYDASIAVSGQIVHVVWYDERNGLAEEIYYKRSEDGGASWGEDTRLTNNAGDSWAPSVSVSDSTVHIAWYDHRDANWEIYYKRSTDGGISWEGDTRLTNDAAQKSNPSISVSDQVVNIVWEDNRDGNYEIYHKGSTDGGINWGADYRLTNAALFSGRPSVAVSGSSLHVVWYDGREGNDEIYYKRNPTGNVTGIETIGLELPGDFKLEQNYPNPFNPSSTIRFQIPSSGFVLLVVHDVLGKEVATLISEQMEAGTYTKQFNVNNITSGVYFYQLQTGNFVETKKFILMK
jgi:hypothetical protein